VIVDHRTELDLLDLDDFLALARFGGLLLRGIFELPVIEKFADRRIGVRRNFHEVETGLGGHLDRGLGLHDSKVRSVLIDQLNFEVADILVDAGPVFLNGGWRSGRTTNGCILLNC